MEMLVKDSVKEEVEGIELEFGASGKPLFLRVNLEMHPVFDTLLRQTGLLNGNGSFGIEDEEEDDSWLIPTEVVEVEGPINWSAKALRSFEQLENKQYNVGNINNFWNV